MTFKHWSYHDTEACILTSKELVSSVYPGSDSLLMLAFVASHWTPQWQSGLQCCSWEIMDHPPYSPDLARSDFHCYEPLKKQLVGKWFTADTNMKQAVTPWLRALDIKFRVFHYTSLSAMVGQALKCLLWLDGGLMCTICSFCVLYIGSQNSSQHQCLSHHFLKFLCMFETMVYLIAQPGWWYH